MPLRNQDRAVWIGSEDVMPIGSSGKVRTISPSGKTALVSWGGDNDRICRIGAEVITCKQAANRGVQPWAKVYDETLTARQRAARKKTKAGVTVDVLNPQSAAPNKEARLTPERKRAGMYLL